ncbi:MAG: Rrf2 family transcriptional regulator [Rhodovibrio sp.]|nr:Rrf2 family transcriptional regulator [Rhodovibrio sp.]
MVLDEPAHCALSVMTLIALAGPRGPRTAPEIAGELELPAAGINRALRDLAAARLLTVELEPARIGYAATRPPSAVTIAEIIEAAHAPHGASFGSTAGQDRGGAVADRAAASAPRAPGTSSRAEDNPGARARQGLMAVLARVTLSDVLHAQTRRVGY